MKISYFSDTDTALIEFSGRTTDETREITENILFDLDSEGNPVSLTIEHASELADLPDISFKQVGKESA